MSVSLVASPEAPPPPPLSSPAPTAYYKCVPILKLVLEGLYDEESNLSKLRGCQPVLQKIWREVREYYKPAILSKVKLDVPQSIGNQNVHIYVSTIRFFQSIYGPGGNGTVTDISSIYSNLNMNLNQSFQNHQESV